MSVSLINGHIDDDVMTDEQIIKALDGADVFLRNRANSEPAQLNEYDIEALIDIANVCDEAANLINRQKAEIERLEIKIEGVQEANAILREHIRKAVKEFAERLTDKADLKVINAFESSWVISQEQIDNLVKEMVGEG